ncbi:MAG: DUF2336 domain-containing protein [Alphaproteobacteria bacterium]
MSGPTNQRRRGTTQAAAPSLDPPRSASAGTRRSRADPSEVDELLALARDKSAASRTRLVAMVSDLFFGKQDVLSERERALMSDILRQLIHDVEMTVRRALAERLSTQPNAPRELIIALANDEIEVAHPILTKSTVLHDPELIEIIAHRTLQHQLAIAMREEVSETVSDALVETESDDVITTLIQNPNARISHTTLEYLVEQSRLLDGYQRPLLGRSDLGADLAKKMYWWVSAALRQHILNNFDVDPTELDDSLETTVRDAVQEVTNYDAAKTKPFELANRLKEAEAITPRLLIQVLRQGEISLFEALFVQFTEIRLNLARRLLYEPGGEGLAVACKASDIGKPDFASIFLLSRKARPGDKVVDPAELSRVLAFFDRIKAEAADAVLRRWRRDEAYLNSIRELELVAANTATD